MGLREQLVGLQAQLMGLREKLMGLRAAYGAARASYGAERAAYGAESSLWGCEEPVGLRERSSWGREQPMGQGAARWCLELSPTPREVAGPCSLPAAGRDRPGVGLVRRGLGSAGSVPTQRGPVHAAPSQGGEQPERVVRGRGLAGRG